MKTLKALNSQTLLVILDGFGHSPNLHRNAIKEANTPNLDQLFTHYPFCTIEPGGVAVGLPKGVAGNSEVGHMNLGAGRPIRQDLVRINEAIEHNTYGQREEFQKLLVQAKKGSRRVHLLGLLSDGGVHSHIKHLQKTIELLNQHPELQVFVHAFMDGRDTAPQNGPSYLQQMTNAQLNFRWGSMQGRSWGMDRDRRWEKIKRAYDTLIGRGKLSGLSAEEYLLEQYSKGLTDEFIEPVLFEQTAAIEAGDAVFFFNFRPDRAIQITLAFNWPAFREFERPVRPAYFLCMTPYCPEEVELPILFDKEPIQGTLSEYLSSLGKKQFKIAETEKFAHITYFFNGGRKEPFPLEERLLIPSPKDAATYDLKPQMAAFEVTEALLKKLEDPSIAFFMVNYANADMVGHTGNFAATVKAIEVLDQCVQRLAQKCLEGNITLMLTADHGNADQLSYPDNTPHTSHTDAPAPFCLVAKGLLNQKLLTVAKNPALKDIAPTVLHSLGIPQPDWFQGQPIFE